MSDLVGHNDKVKTKVLQKFDFAGKQRITIEEILEGKYKNRYLVKSFTKSLFGYKLSTLSATNIETDSQGNRIVKIEFRAHRMLKQALAFAKHIKKDYYPIWSKMQ